MHPYVAALQRDASVSPGAAIESIGGRNRGGVRQLCCFEQHTCSIHRLLRLSGIIWGWADQTTFVYPPIGTFASSMTTAYFGSRGTGSWPGTTIGCWCYRYDWAGDYVSPRQCLGPDRRGMRACRCHRRGRWGLYPRRTRGLLWRWRDCL